MSSLVVQVTRIDEVSPHTNADKLELGKIGGWQVVLPKGRYHAGDRVVYIPPDSVLPLALSEKIGVTKYLHNGRVKCAKLRGEPSFGVVWNVENPLWEDGFDVAEYYGITKYKPGPSSRKGASCASLRTEFEHPAFAKYTNIENLRHNPTVFTEGEEVVICEKLHGCCTRNGIIDGDWISGSRNRQVMIPHKSKNLSLLGRFKHWITRTPTRIPDWHACSKTWFTFPLSLYDVRELLECTDNKVAVLYGEVYGNVQQLKYGIDGLAFRAFDLMLDGKFLDYDDFAETCRFHEVPIAPVLYRGPYNLDIVKGLAEGKSTLSDADHIREGVVVRPVKERTEHRHGRIIFKYVGDGYLLGDPDETDDA